MPFQYLPPAYVVRREGTVFTGMCFSIGVGWACPSLCSLVLSLGRVSEYQVPSPFQEVLPIPHPGQGYPPLLMSGGLSCLCYNRHLSMWLSNKRMFLAKRQQKWLRTIIEMQRSEFPWNLEYLWLKYTCHDRDHKLFDDWINSEDSMEFLPLNLSACCGVVVGRRNIKS